MKEEALEAARGIAFSAGRSLTPELEELAISYGEGRLSSAEAFLLMSMGEEHAEEHHHHDHEHHHHAPLDNLLGIEDEKLLLKVDSLFSFGRSYRLLCQPVVEVNGFGINTLSRIHYALFSDIYPFAGRVRTEEELRARLTECARRLVSLKYLRGLEKEAFIAELASVHASMTAIHPFRAGNGRTIRLFLTLLSRRAGYQMDYGAVPAEEKGAADRAALSGDCTPLVKMYARMVTPYTGSQRILVIRQEGQMGPIIKEDGDEGTA